MSTYEYTGTARYSKSEFDRGPEWDSIGMGTCIAPGAGVADRADVNRDPNLQALLVPREPPERKMLGIKV